jgi:release factor glutamine methyltransferase
LEAAWAGGEDGRYWIDIVLPRIDGLLSEKGLFYMIVLEANKPEELMEWAKREWDLQSEMVLRRKCGIEDLRVLKFWRRQKNNAS